MIRTSRHRQRLAGILLFALMLQSLWPAMAGVTDRSGRWIEVCANSGVKWVQLDAQTTVSDHGSDSHCMLCAATGAAPDFDARDYLQSPAVDARPQFAVVAARPVFPGHALQVRAPPVLS